LRLIKHVITGATMDNEEGMIVDLLTANTHDAPDKLLSRH